ncbi:hypothetical protein F4811DRAFT_549968 [Daldinia bambusicola]|nr:hypothetical protein F4811DRAFT_549968 [Daldinia bambusicola]
MKPSAIEMTHTSSSSKHAWKLSPITRSATAATAREGNAANPTVSPRKSPVPPETKQSSSVSVVTEGKNVTPKAEQTSNPLRKVTTSPNALAAGVTQNLPAPSSPATSKNKEPRRLNQPVVTPTKITVEFLDRSGTTVTRARNNNAPLLPSTPTRASKRTRPIAVVDPDDDEDDAASPRKRRMETPRKTQESPSQRSNPPPATPVKRGPVKHNKVSAAASSAKDMSHARYPEYPELEDLDPEEDWRDAERPENMGFAEWPEDPNEDLYYEEENVDDEGEDGEEKRMREEMREEMEAQEAQLDDWGYASYARYDAEEMFFSPRARRHYDLGPNLAAAVPLHTSLDPPMVYPRPPTPPPPGEPFYHPHFPDRKPLRCSRCSDRSAVRFEVVTSRTTHNPGRYFYRCEECTKMICWADAERISPAHPRCKCGHPSREELSNESAWHARTVFYKCATGRCGFWRWSDTQLSERQVNRRYGQLLYRDAA